MGGKSRIAKYRPIGPMQYRNVSKMLVIIKTFDVILRSSSVKVVREIPIH